MSAPTIVYAYSRFSSAAQADGDSVRRQASLRDAWLKRHPEYTLDKKLLVDAGVSGFQGGNRKDERNALARFLAMVESGKVAPGSVLLVESVDRLSREHPQDAVPLLLWIISRGIKLVTLSPTEMMYEQGMDVGRMMILLMEAFRGHSESAIKKERCGEAWGELKKKAREEKRPLGKNLHPAWVTIENGRHVLIPERADAVRKVYELAANGWSTFEITRHLNKTGVPAFGRSGRWTRSYIQKIIMGREALGEYQPAFGNRRRVKDGDVIEGYWPAVVTPEMWDRVRAGAAARTTNPPPRRPGRAAHPLQGLLMDALDQCPMQTLTLRNRKYVVSSKGFEDPRGDTHRRPFPLDVLQHELLTQMRELVSTDLFADPSLARISKLRADLSDTERRLRVAVERFEADPENATWAAQVDKYDQRKRELSREIVREEAETANPLPARWEEAVSLMAADEPARLRLALGLVVDEIRVVVVKAGQRRVCAAQAFFKGGSVRSYIIAWRRSIRLPHCSRPDRQVCLTFAEAGAPDALDLRKPDHARRLEKFLSKLDAATLV